MDNKFFLHTRIKEQKWHQVIDLVKHSADVNKCDEHNSTPLHEAMKQQYVPLDVVTQLISPQNINMQDHDGKTPLHHAAWFNEEFRKHKLVPFLIYNGADVNLSDKDGLTPLQYIFMPGIPILRVCIVDQLISTQNVNIETILGKTGLNMLLTKRLLNYERNIGSLIWSFIKHGAEYSIIDVIRFMTTKYQLESMRLLLQHLPMPFHLTHVEFICLEGNITDRMKINNKRIYVSCKSVSLACFVDIICHLLQQTCLLKTQCYTGVEDIPADVDADIVSHVISKYKELNEMSSKTDTLQKLCMITIRQHLPSKTDENFAKLGLPPVLLSLVKLHTLADEIDLMQHQCHEENVLQGSLLP